MHVDTWRMHTAEVVVPLSDDFVETPLGDCTHISTSCMPVYRRAAASAWRLTQAQQSRREKPWSEKEAKRGEQEEAKRGGAVGEDKEEQAIMSQRFVTGSQYPRWMQEYDEMAANGTWASLSPLPCTALP